METSQLICNADQLIDFYTKQVFTERYFRTEIINNYNNYNYKYKQIF